MTDSGTDKVKKRHRAGGAGGGAGYCLGFIGALVYFIHTATGLSDGAYGVLQALFWPAYLIYGLFGHLHM